MCQLTYCIECEQWIEFAVEMAHLKPMANLLSFIRSKLDRLHIAISYQTLSMLGAAALFNEERRFKRLLEGIGHRMCWDGDVDAVICKYGHWYQLREHLLIMFRRYVQMDGTAGRDIGELNEFLEYLKQWNFESVMDIDRHPKWRTLEEHEGTLRVLNDRQFSEVFLRLWYHKRKEIEQRQKALFGRYRAERNIADPASKRNDNAGGGGNADDGKEDEKEAVSSEEAVPDLFGQSGSTSSEEDMFGGGPRRKRRRKIPTRFQWTFEV